jgi:hypothetical protein
MIRFLRACFRFARHQAYVIPPEWNDADAEFFLNFLQSPTGQRLRAHLSNATIRQASQAITSSRENLDYACGYAAGFRGAVMLFETMTRISEPEIQDSISEFEHLSP